MASTCSYPTGRPPRRADLPQRRDDRRRAAKRRALGEGYGAGATVARAFRGCGARYSPRPSVWEVGAGARRTDGTAPFEFGVLQNGIARMVYARCVIVATGARERTVPALGALLHGVIGAGGASGAGDAVYTRLSP